MKKIIIKNLLLSFLSVIKKRLEKKTPPIIIPKWEFSKNILLVKFILKIFEKTLIKKKLLLHWPSLNNASELIAKGIRIIKKDWRAYNINR